MIKKIINLITIIYVTAFIINIYSCGNSTQSITDTNASVILNTNSLEINSQLYFYNVGSSKTVLLDSATYTKGNPIKFDVSLSQTPDVFMLVVAPNQIINVIMEQGDNAIIDLQSLPVIGNYSIVGSNESNKLFVINNIIDGHIAKHDSIYSSYRRANNTERTESFKNRTDSLLKENYYQVYIELKAQIRNNPASLSSLVGLYSKYGNSPILNFDLDFDIFNLVADSLIAKYPNNTHAIALANKVSNKNSKDKLIEMRYRKLSKGNIFPELSLLSLDNQKQNINNINAKYKIIYLWKPTTKSFFEYNTVLQKLYEKYASKTKHLEIIGISFEKDKLAWKNYCRMEKMVWNNFIANIDTENLINPKTKYCMIYLLDQNNNIIARDVDINNLENLISK